MNVQQTLDVLINFPMSESIMLIGDHGIGKSRIVRKAAEMMGIPCIDFRLSQNDVGDLKGMPFRVGLNTVFAPPEWYPITLDDAQSLAEAIGIAVNEVKAGAYGDRGILFLDEINRANREVQQAAFELVLDKRLNLRPLPEGWRVVTAVNGNDSIYSVNAIDPAFLSRFFVVDFKPSVEDWFKWAAGDGNIHSAVLEFLRRFPDFLDPTSTYLAEQSAKEVGQAKVHDRRAWEKFSHTIQKYEEDESSGKRTGNILGKSAADLDFMTMIARGYVGFMAAQKFRSFIQTDYKTLDGDTILNKWSKDVEKHLKKIVEDHRITEMSAYNESLMIYFEKNKSKKLNDAQKMNLKKYLELLPKEVVSDFWHSFNKKHKEISEDWFKDKKVNAPKLIFKVLINPEALEKIKNK